MFPKFTTRSNWIANHWKHANQLGMTYHLTLSKWAKQYGKLYTINIFGKPALVINDSKTMQDLLGTLSSTGKYDLELLDIIHGANHGILTTEGSVWFEQHKFFIKILRQFGFRGRNQNYSEVVNECNKLCNWMDGQIGQDTSESFHLGEAFLNSVSNIIWTTVTGEEEKSEDNKIVEILENLVKLLNEASLLIFMPWLRFIAPGLSGYTNLVNTANKFHEQVQNTFEKHKKARMLNQNGYVTDNMIDAYLEQVENCQNANSTFYGEKGMKHSFSAVVNMLFGGSETTASTITWLIHYLLAYPVVQKKLQDEVDAVANDEDESSNSVGNIRLPYLEAVVMETLRMCSVAPLGALHKLLDDVTYDGYTFSKGTFLLANIYGANMDPWVWKDPEVLRPERFLEGTEQEKRNLMDCVVTFQKGRRKCPGEQAAKDMLFLYAFKLVKKYSFHAEENRNVSEYLNPILGTLLLPPKLGVVMKRRNE